MPSLLNDIIGQFGLPENPKSQLIPRDAVVRWMQTDDLEALGALYAFLMDPNYAKRVVPQLEFSDYVRFLTRYFERCFHEDPDGDWCHSRYAAAWDFASWFGSIWKNDQIDRKELTKIKDWLARVYKNSDEPTKRALIDGALEHLFENQKIARFFSTWKVDSELAGAFAEAAQWARRGGKAGLLR